MKSKLSVMLAAKRSEKQLTKKQTAKLMGVTPMYYARFENNNLTPSKRNLDFLLIFWRLIKMNFGLFLRKRRK